MTPEEKRDIDISETIENMRKGLLLPWEAEGSMKSICDEYARQKSGGLPTEPAITKKDGYIEVRGTYPV